MLPNAGYTMQHVDLKDKPVNTKLLLNFIALRENFIGKHI